MQGGDSGGPLFDMQGRVVGINSRISGNLAMNMHAPVDALMGEWQELPRARLPNLAVAVAASASAYR